MTIRHLLPLRLLATPRGRWGVVLQLGALSSRWRNGFAAWRRDFELSGGGHVTIDLGTPTLRNTRTTLARLPDWC